MRSIIFASILSFMLITQAFAKFGFDDVIGVVTDPIGLKSAGDDAVTAVKEAGAIVDRLNAYLTTIQNELDADARVYIAEANALVERVNQAVADRSTQLDEIVHGAISDLSGLELQIYGHTRELITCGTALMQRSVEETLADGINQLAEASPGIDFLWWRIITFTVKPTDIKDPINDYKSLMAAYRQMLAGLGPDSDPNIVVSALGEMQRITLRTKCFYEQTTLEMELLTQFSKLKWEAAPWNGLTSFEQMQNQ